ncbi:MAG TPA: carbohydrate binding domain-containing protein [Prosthecobacter sp.]|nr:carbohydrate binding domain-containing protein [Prosthecobacter sp.]
MAFAPTFASAQEKTSSRENLFVNGSFAKNLEGWNVRSSVPGGTAVIDEAETRDGRPTLRISNPKGNDTFVTQKVTLKPNMRYRITGYIKTKDVVPDKRTSKDGASISISGGFETTDRVQKTKPWAKVELEFESGGKTEMTIGPRLGQYHNTVVGTAWFADLELVEIGRARK